MREEEQDGSILNKPKRKLFFLQLGVFFSESLALMATYIIFTALFILLGWNFDDRSDYPIPYAIRFLFLSWLLASFISIIISALLGFRKGLRQIMGKDGHEQVRENKKI